MNEYEKDAIGVYESHTQVSSQKEITHHLLLLNLGKDKCCTISYGVKSFRGKWKIYDNGDHTIINIFTNSHRYDPIIEGYIGNGIVKLWSHSDSLLNEYDEVVFKLRE